MNNYNNQEFTIMTLLKKITDLWNTLLRKMKEQEEMLDTNGRTGLAFPTTGIIGAIAGDCCGAAYEFHPAKHGDFDIYKEPRFTDDTVMTLAVATKGMEMPKELARCVYNNVLDDNLRQILDEFNRGY